VNERAQGREPSQEQLLLDYIQRLDRYREGRRAIHLHLSRLQPYNRREHHLRIACSCFDMLVKKFDGGLFRIGNDDLIFIAKGAGVADLEAVVQKLRYLFTTDPLLQAGGDDLSGFCSWYALDEDYVALKNVAEGLDSDARHHRMKSAEQAKPPAAPMDSRRLTQIERAINAADLSFLIRRQPICFVAPGRPPEPLMQEIYVSIDELARAVLPGTDLRGDRWLFQHLTRLLDQRVLATLMHRDELDPASGFALNLNVSTTLGPIFQDFDRAVGATRARAAVIELQMIDIFADPSSFMFARDWLKGRGYKLCLDGVKPLLLPLIDRDWLAVDLIKLDWGPDLAGDLDAPTGARLRTAIETIGRDRVIMCHCDTAQALTAGEQLGITMFQGRHFDRLLREPARPVARRA